ncbi:MAG: PQQ-binding-like beta-propeller repeat protein [Propionibacteriaceae bacterium]|nr:PQQ-binding-like beta-propeller repeat protein [Propionibacteriaceae bacterium]
MARFGFRGAAVLVCAAALLAGCTAPDSVTSGSRPNKPTAVSTPAFSPVTDPKALSIPLDDVPAYKAAEPDAQGWTTGKMTGSDGTFRWRTVGEDGKYLQYSLPALLTSCTVQEDGTKVCDDAVSNPSQVCGADECKLDPDAFKTAWGDPQTYTKVPGVLTFRGNNYRTAPAYGQAEVKDKKLEIVWEQEIGEVRGDKSYWPGAGWTGQPLLVNWPRETRQAMGFADEFAEKDLVEVIYPVFEGKVYRLDLETGKQTKEPMEGCGGFKGTGSIDPRGYPLLYAGQGLDDMNGTPCAFRYRIFDLIQNKEVSGWAGDDDPARPRKEWGAFDSSALVNGPSDTLIEPAENGLVYKVKLNAKFDAAAKTVSVDPQISRLAYETPVTQEHGIESSAVAYRNLVFASDNDGNLICWDANTLAVVWVRDIGDDSDATMVLEETSEGVFLYHGNTLDKRGKEGGSGDLNTYLRKINALTGELVWERPVPTVPDYPNNGGELATPALGQGEVSDLVIFNVSKTNSKREGDMLALNKADGTIAWTRHLGRYSWSSPVLFSGTDGHQYGIICDSGGTMHLFDPNTGVDLSTVSLGKNIESSPAIYNNMIVVASYAKKIFGIKIS